MWFKVVPRPTPAVFAESPNRPEKITLITSTRYIRFYRMTSGSEIIKKVRLIR
jgi:hypothetical protein